MNKYNFSQTEITGIQIWLKRLNKYKLRYCPFLVGRSCDLCKEIFPNLEERYSKIKLTNRKYDYDCPCGVYSLKYIIKKSRKIIKEIEEI